MAQPGIVRGIVLLVGLVIVPLGWVLPPWIATGHPLEASSHARIYARGHAAAVHTGLLLEVLKRATELTVWPVLIAALGLTVIAVWARDWVIVTLAGLSLSYVAVVEVMTLAGYPGLERFMLPAAALACVLAAVGVVRLATLAGGGLTSLAAVGLLVAIAAPAFAGPYQADCDAAAAGLDRGPQLRRPVRGGAPGGRRRADLCVPIKLGLDQPHGGDRLRVGSRRAAGPRARGDVR